MTQTHFPYSRPRAFSAVKSPARGRGFSLVEIMVALVIGLIGVLVIMQVARTGEAQKRVTTGSGDAQNNGALSIYSIQRDMKQAGYGFSSLNVLGCPLTLPTGALGHLAPVAINSSDVPAGHSDSDTLLIVYGNSSGSPEGDIITLSSGPWIGVMSASNYRVNEWVIAGPGSPEDTCPLVMGKVDQVGASNVHVSPSPGAKETGNLFDLGDNPRIVGYAVRNENLTTCDYMYDNCSNLGNWQVVANGIVSLRAQFGYVGSGGSVVWSRNQPPLGLGEVSSCPWARISAVRLAVVARNSEPSRDEVTTQDLEWAATRDSTDDPISLSVIGGKNYRYQVYETVMPLRNIPWMGACS